jgi:hypothetical protein
MGEAKSPSPAVQVVFKGDLDPFAAQAFLNFSGVEWRNGRACPVRRRSR